MTSFIDAAKRVLRFDEGFQASPYRDTVGLWTIGVGHMIGDDLSKLKLSDSAIEALLESDIEIHLTFIRHIFGTEFFDSLTVARQVALLSLGFNMGMNLLKFKHTIELIKDRNWETAAYNLGMSKWAHDVDPRQRKGVGRDDRVIEMLRTGIFPLDYGIK